MCNVEGVKTSPEMVASDYTFMYPMAVGKRIPVEHGEVFEYALFIELNMCWHRRSKTENLQHDKNLYEAAKDIFH